MQNLVHMKNTVIFKPELYWQFIETKLNSFLEGSSYHLLVVYVQILLKFQGDIVQNGQ